MRKQEGGEADTRLLPSEAGTRSATTLATAPRRKAASFGPPCALYGSDAGRRQSCPARGQSREVALRTSAVLGSRSRPPVPREATARRRGAGGVEVPGRGRSQGPMGSSGSRKLDLSPLTTNRLREITPRRSVHRVTGFPQQVVSAGRSTRRSREWGRIVAAGREILRSVSVMMADDQLLYGLPVATTFPSEAYSENDCRGCVDSVYAQVVAAVQEEGGAVASVELDQVARPPPAAGSRGR